MDILKNEREADKFIIRESPPLRGTVKISGSKNSVLPIMAASLLTEDVCVVSEIPDLSDVRVMRALIGDLGAETGWKQEISIDADSGSRSAPVKSGVMTICASKINKSEVSYELAGRMRASFLLMGPLLARRSIARLPLPGGCAIGARPVDLHLKGLSALGAEINQEHGYVTVTAKKLTGAKIYLDFPSVGATENIIMAAVLANGQTIIENCAIEPEIVDLANFLNSIGADIRGAGTDTVKINGVQGLKGGEHMVIPDRIEAGTFMVAAAISGGDIYLENVVGDHLKPIIAKLREINVEISDTPAGLRVLVPSLSGLRGTDLKTLPYPGFPTDMQAQFLSLLTLVEGTSIVTETVFENRFMHVGELKRMGADIKIESRSAIVEGVEMLTGTQVRATDLRAGAALVLASLRAKDMTEISDIYHIDRGYCDIDSKLRALGARIERVN